MVSTSVRKEAEGGNWASDAHKDRLTHSHQKELTGKHCGPIWEEQSNCEGFGRPYVKADAMGPWFNSGDGAGAAWALCTHEI